MDLGKKEKEDETIEIRIEGGKKDEDEEKKIKTSGSNKFKQFDIIPKVFCNKDDSIFSDHYYYRDKPTTDFSIRTNNSIEKEWCILKQGLPDSIFVRVYEGRKDLLKAVIIGPKGTPYHDGLFFIDIQFPYDYPNKPPKLHYRTIGLRFKTIYFPLPQTCWDPCQSTVLQVLVAIYQNLIFSTRLINLKGDIVAYKERIDYWDIDDSSFMKSYYTWHRNNMSIFHSSCTNMVAVLKKPPKHFEEFVAQHFRDRAKIILNACLDYDRTYKPANPKNSLEYYEAAATTTGNPTRRVTDIFYEEMSCTYGSLLKAFIKNGSDSLENYRVGMDPKLKHMGFVFLICIVCVTVVMWPAKKFHWFGS
ncbi:hypothetical protein MKW98_028612 [Papaver atlanticum]|uniref:UBC core domain-containing protein n=1 Tax=Papaver atlanticum TaxID=357466 RepID=A0AAD4X672_9MAGN|nr:hypothetical protein MKW98_028612 [Papaver atlanticum]